MKVGISTATFFSKLLTEDTFSVIKQCGGETAEVFLTTFCEYEPSFGELLMQRKGDLDIYSVHALNTAFEPQLFNIAARTRDDAEIIYRRVLAVGQQLGAKCYTFHGTSRLKKNAVLDEVYIGERMKELGDIAADYGIKLCFENVHWAAYNSPDFFETVGQYAPNIGTVLDIKQAWQSGYDWRDYLRVMGDRISNVHISDVCTNARGNKQVCMVGKGEFPFEELCRTLIENNYQGPIIIEQYAGNYDGYQEVAASVEYLKNLIGGIYANQI